MGGGRRRSDLSLFVDETLSARGCGGDEIRENKVEVQCLHHAEKLAL